jgi:hypothetical protein
MPSAAVNAELKRRRDFDAAVVQLPANQQEPAIITENSRRAALPQIVKNGVIAELKELKRIADLELGAAASLANNMQKGGRRRKTRKGRKGRKGRKHTVRKY